MISKCPGQDTRFWGPNDIYTVECPKCGRSMEFFKDDIRRRCQKCGHMFLNPKLNLGCAQWCQYADQCLGTIGREEITENLVLTMKEYFDGAKERIDHSLEVLRFAEEILEEEKGNPKVVISASILHEIGIHEMKTRHTRNKGSDQEKSGFPIVRGILERSGCEKEVIEEICRLIESHHRKARVDTLNGKIVHDADWLASLKDKYDIRNKKELKKIIKKVFLTPAGKKLAEETYLCY